jgi:hypothetical protein
MPSPLLWSLTRLYRAFELGGNPFLGANRRNCAPKGTIGQEKTIYILWPTCLRLREDPSPRGVAKVMQNGGRRRKSLTEMERAKGFEC